ncbi:MAG: tetratricopeptide repeat protein, partial [Cyanobacteria bacterium HKST-UBA02]|nr:tetratricopeptide repeat protein [Cyanobacteria bacterium HKST-UBA02]
MVEYYMSDNFRAKLVLIAIVLSAFALPVLAANTGCPGDSHGSYGTRKTLWYKALGPDHSDVTAVLNGLNFGPLNQKRAKEFDAALPTLLTALDVAQKYEDEFPDDVVESFCNLGAFYFLTHNYDKSDKHFESALNEAMKQERPILEVASIIDYRATVARARNDLNTAESYQELAKNIRAGVYRPEHRDLAHSSHSKALILFDRCSNHYDPEVYRQAVQLERKGLGASYGDVLVKMRELAEWIIA